MITLEDLRRRCTHPLSRYLPVNTHQRREDFPAYVSDIREYGMFKTGIGDFRDGNWKLGWKMHLNVAPENIVAVSRYLHEHRFVHKFLGGGEIEDGKIFTIRLGSAIYAQKATEQMSRDLGDLLCRPVDDCEAEFAPGVVGRFRDPFVRLDGPTFAQYGSAGVSYVEPIIPRRLVTCDEFPTMEKKIAFAETHAYGWLEKLHGSFFRG